MAVCTDVSGVCIWKDKCRARTRTRPRLPPGSSRRGRPGPRSHQQHTWVRWATSSLTHDIVSPSHLAMTAGERENFIVVWTRGKGAERQFVGVWPSLVREGPFKSVVFFFFFF